MMRFASCRAVEISAWPRLRALLAADSRALTLQNLDFCLFEMVVQNDEESHGIYKVKKSPRVRRNLNMKFLHQWAKKNRRTFDNFSLIYP